MPGMPFLEAYEDDRALQLAIELQHLMTMGDSNTTISDDLGAYYPTCEDVRNKKSQNMTECVPVPSSEHVAEIVGRQGCKIKALRAKTNTYIKTPVRGEEPVFVVTGRKEDVAKAKREILSAAEHFSQIRASRKNGLMGLSPPGPPMKTPGQVTIQVRVPYRVVGLVVGPKGATIKRIQQKTSTYIVTPSRDKEPVFEVTGMGEAVQAAREEIESHIALRTGSLANLPEMMPNAGFENSNDLLSALCKTNLPFGFENILNMFEPQHLNSNDPLGILSSNSNDSLGILSSNSASSGAFSSSGSVSSHSSSSGGRLADIWGTSLDRDEGIGESPSLESNIWSFPSTRPSPSESASPTDSLCKRECQVCMDREANTILMPCGHGNYCCECASRISPLFCPVLTCNTPIGTIMRTSVS